MADIVYPFILAKEKDAIPENIDDNLGAVKTQVNGNLQDSNIKVGAAINPAKIAGTALVATDPVVAATNNSIPKRDGNGDLTIKSLIGTSGTNIEVRALGSDTIILRPSNTSNANGLTIDEDGGNFISFATGQANGFLFNKSTTFQGSVFLKNFTTAGRPSAGAATGQIIMNTTDDQLNTSVSGGSWDTVISAQSSDIVPTGDTATNGHITVTIDGTAVKLATVA